MARKSGAPPKWMVEIAEGENYQQRFKVRAEAGILAPAVETRFLEHVYGKPAETVDLNIHEDLSSKSPEELMSLLEKLRGDLREIQELKASVH